MDADILDLKVYYQSTNDLLKINYFIIYILYAYFVVDKLCDLASD